MALPPHPADDDTPVKTMSGWRTKAIIALAVMLIVVVVVLHLTGVIGGGH
jgi:hypothetical protein